MSMQVKVIVLFVLIAITTTRLEAQKWLDQVGKIVKQGGNQAVDDSKVAFDSVDFQFAISVNENASFFNVQQKGEGLTKTADFF